MSTAVFPGSFDPVTVGHVDIIRRAASVYDRVIVAVTANPGKGESAFSLEDRMDMISEAIRDIPNAEVGVCDGLLVDFCRSVGAGVIVRGIRSGADVDYEAMLEAVNTRLAPDIITVYLLAKPEHAYISSSLVRQLLGIGIGIEGLVPNADHKSLRRE